MFKEKCKSTFRNFKRIMISKKEYYLERLKIKRLTTL